VILDFAVPGIATACIPDADERLRRLLTEAIAICRELAGKGSRCDTVTEAPARLQPDQWRDVVAPAKVG